MEFKDIKFEPIGEAAKAYPESTLVIRKQFFDGVVARFQDTIRTRTGMLVEEQKIRVGLAENFQKEYHKTFELQEQIRKQKYRRCLAMAKWCRLHDEFTILESERLGLPQRAIFMEYRRKAMWWCKWHKRWLKLAERYKQPIEPIEKDLK